MKTGNDYLYYQKDKEQFEQGIKEFKKGLPKETAIKLIDVRYIPLTETVYNAVLVIKLSGELQTKITKISGVMIEHISSRIYNVYISNKDLENKVKEVIASYKPKKNKKKK